MQMNESNNVIVVQVTSPQNRRDLIVHYLRAVERFRKANAENSPNTNSINNESYGWGALGEALFWLYTIFEHLKSKPEIVFEDLELKSAFESARALIQHASWYGISTKLVPTANGQTNTWQWGKRPENERTRNQALEGKENYIKRLQDKPVLETFDEISISLWKIRGWQISIDDVQQPGFEVLSPIKFDDKSLSNTEPQ